ncbi:hypothetical protein [Leucobacter chironomi]|uniref:hypothetical protein n=1 Tax=Leucobacter chironomi TaxID=491918 RepID=UPI0004262F88|nr:hypothetical protein [Leucobacter chironomi]
MTTPLRPRALLAAGIAGLLAVSLASCAPEPDEIAGAKSKEQIANGEETEDPGQRAQVPEEALQKQAELPAGFPSDRFPLPKDAVIDDAGERGAGVWFVVLRAKDAAQASTQWSAIISAGGFEAADQQGDPASADASAMLRSASLEAFALMLVQDDGSVLLSYDLTEQ